MKILSPILKVVALLAAAFCVYAWFDVRGKISSAEADLSDFNGTTLAEKTPHAKVIFKEHKERGATIESFKKRVAGLEKEIAGLNSELESERAKNVAANADIVKCNSEIRSLNSKLTAVSKQVQEREATIESLKKEILASKELLAKQDDTEALKEKISSLERKVSEQAKESEKALEKAKIADMAEIVEVIETNDNGQKVRRKFVRVPYVPKGDIATVIHVSGNTVVINKGKKDGLSEAQHVLLKKEGETVAKAIVMQVADDRAALSTSDTAGIPEIIAVNEQFELASEVVETKKDEEKSEAKAEEKSDEQKSDSEEKSE